MYGDRCKYVHLTMDEYEAKLKMEKEAKEKGAEEKVETKGAVVEEKAETTDAMVEEKAETTDAMVEEKKETQDTVAPENLQTTNDQPAETEANQETETNSTKENPPAATQPAKEASDSEDYEKADEDEGQICTMLPILTHSKIEGYRNKCTFTIGKDRNGAPCIGFRMGSFINGNVIIGPVE